MVKKTEYLGEAEKLYVEGQLTLKEISGRLPVSYSTLRSWSRRGGWDRKRQDLLTEKEAFHRDIYTLARELTAAIRADMRAGREVSAQRIHSVTRLILSLGRARDYEATAPSLPEEKEDPRSTKEIMAKIEELLFGESPRG